MGSTHRPFNGVVTDVSECRSMAEVVEMVPYFGKEIGTMPVYGVEWDDLERPTVHELKEYKAPTLDGEPIGPIVGQHYGIGQPKVDVEIAQWLIDQLGARPASVGHWRNGARSIIELSFPETQFTINRGGREDHFDPRVSILNGCTGLHGWELALVMFQMFCMNQWASAVGENAKKFRHTSRIHDRVGDAKLFLAEVVDRTSKERETLTALEDTNLTQQDFFTFCAQLLTGKDNGEEALQAVEESEGRSRSILGRKFDTLATLYQSGVGNRGQTALDAFSAVTEWRTWGGQAEEDANLMARAMTRRTAGIIGSVEDTISESNEVLDEAERRRQEIRFQSNLEGNSRHMVERARKLLLARAA